MKTTALSQIEATGIIAILRATSSQSLIQAAAALLQGGVTVIEVTMTTPGALQVISDVRSKFNDDVAFGAGSVLDPETARAAILAGAGFIVMPTVNLRVVELCQRYSIPVIPGAYTPTEIINAWEAGADMIKLFPASIGGPDMLRALLAPLPQVKLVPVGGINLENTPDFIHAGAAAVGVGSSLVNDTLLKSGKFEEITQRARLYIQQVSKARSN